MIPIWLFKNQANSILKKLLTNKKKISNEDYEHALKVWNTFEMQSMKDYFDLHLKSDLLLLADTFEKIRNSSSKIMDYALVII